MSTAKFANYIYRPFCGKDCFDKNFKYKITIRNKKHEVVQQQSHQQIVEASSEIPTGEVIVENISQFLQLGTKLSRDLFDVTSSSYGIKHFQPGLFYWKANPNVVYDSRSAISWFHLLKRSSEPTEYNCEIVTTSIDDEKGPSLRSTRAMQRGTELVLKYDKEESVYYLSDPSECDYHYEWDQF
jgi:hypothetical protein